MLALFIHDVCRENIGYCPALNYHLNFWISLACRYKKTIICQEVAKAKNVCQVCLLDLDYSIPVQARDAALGVEDEVLPESDVGKEYKLKELENAGTLDSSFSKVRPGCQQHPCQDNVVRPRGTACQ